MATAAVFPGKEQLSSGPAGPESDRIPQFNSDCYRAHLEGFYYKPRLTRNSCRHITPVWWLFPPAWRVRSRSIFWPGAGKRHKSALWYKETFGDFYLEIQRHPIHELEMVNTVLIEISHETGIPMVRPTTRITSTRGCSTHDLLLCIGTNSLVTDQKRMKMQGDFFYLKTSMKWRKPTEISRGAGEYHKSPKCAT